jgi:hypothetical protein
MMTSRLFLARPYRPAPVTAHLAGGHQLHKRGHQAIVKASSELQICLRSSRRVYIPIRGAGYGHQNRIDGLDRAVFMLMSWPRLDIDESRRVSRISVDIFGGWVLLLPSMLTIQQHLRTQPRHNFIPDFMYLTSPWKSNTLDQPGYLVFASWR